MRHRAISYVYIVVFFTLASFLPFFAHADTNTFSQNHQLWDRGINVQQLQEFLNAQGFLLAQFGPGSSGHETEIFGLLTYHALLKYQKANNLPATGYFGPQTRAYIASSPAGSPSGANTTNASQSAAASNAATPSSPTSTNTISLVSPGYGGGGGNVAATPSCAIGATPPTVTLGDSSLLTWSSTDANSASLTGTGSVPISGSENVTPNTTSAYTLTVTATSEATASCQTTVTVVGSGDTTPPTVQLTAPSNGATVGGAVTLSANASDNVAVADVQFKVGNTNIGSPILAAPYTTMWNTTGTTTPDGSYTLSAVAADTSGNLATSSVGVTVRNTPPILSSISTTPSYTTATTTWMTDEVANSKVVYGLTAGYGLASSSTAVVTSHSIILSGLTSSSTYHYAVVSADAEGNTSTSSDQTFTTPATSTPPVISNISSGTPTTTAATVTWTTDQSSNSKVVWGLTASYGSSSSSASFVTSHSISISGLATSTMYHFAVVSANSFGATATSSDQNFTTASGVPDTTPPTEPTSLVATPQSSSQINLTWTASTDNGGNDSCCTYQVFRDGTQIATSSTNSYNDTGLSPSALHSYWIDAVDAANNVSTTTSGISAETEAGADQFGTTWNPLRIGAGGYITGIDIAPDGTKVIRTDTYGAYLWDGTHWDQLVNANSMPASFVNTQTDNAGVYEIAVAPSDSNWLYMEFEGYVFRSANRGVTWTLTNFPKATWNANENDSYRFFGRKMAVDPVNPNIVVVGTPQNGVYITTNAGNTWTAVSTSSIPLSTPIGGVYPGMLVAFDPTSAVVGGATQGIYVASYGNGVYHSTNGGTAWTELNSAGMPTTFSHMVAAQDGVLYVADNADNNLQIFSSGAWSSVSVGSNGNPLFAIAVDPSNANRVVVVNDAGNLSVTTNHAATFIGYSTSNSLTATDVPWLAGISSTFLSAGDIAFDPSGSNTLFYSFGYGVLVTNPSNAATTTVDWTSQSRGIEQLVTNNIISPPGGNPIVGVEDRGVFVIDNPDVFPSHSQEGPVSTPFSQFAGWDIDYASNNPNYIAGLINWASDASSYSINGGQTWTKFSTMPANIEGGVLGGSIAAASSTDILVFPSSNNTPSYTLDGGNTWHPISISGVPTSGETGWGFSEWIDREIVAADRVNIGTFYAYNYGPTAAPSAAGVYRSTDGGVTWSHVYTSAFPFSGFNAQMKTVPGVSGEIYFTSGPQSGDSTSSPQSEDFYRSTDGGTTWTAIPTVLEVYSFGFGKAAPGTTTPAIYIVGFVNSKYGIYESDDNANTWTQIGVWPINWLDSVRTVSGDMNAYGRVYLGFGGSGYIYGNTANAQIPPIIGSISSGTPTTTAATITWTTDQSSNSKVVYGTTTNYGSASSSASLVTSHSITLTGLTLGTTYHFEVVSANASGYTATSTDQTFTTFNSTPPSVPTGLTATATSSSEIDLSWNASTGDGTFPVAGYQIFRNGAQVGTSTAGTTFDDTGLSAGTSFSYTVDAYDTGGNVSAQSSSVSTSTLSGVTFTPTANPAIQLLAFSTTTATFSNVNIGSPSSGRVVVVGAAGDNIACLINSVTIGGTAATRIASSIVSGGFQYQASLWYAQISSGTTANIVTTCTGSAWNLAGILVGALTGTATSGPTTVALHPGDNTADPQLIPTTGSIAVPSDGAAVIFGGVGSTGNNTVTWTNTTNASGDFYVATSTSNTLAALMAHSYAAGSESYSVQGSVGNGFGSNGFAGIVAAWSP